MLFSLASLLIGSTIPKGPVKCGRGTVMDKDGTCVASIPKIAAPDTSAKALHLTVPGARLTLEAIGCDERLEAANQTDGPPQGSEDVAELRREIDALKDLARGFVNRTELETTAKRDFSVVFLEEDKSDPLLHSQAFQAVADSFQATKSYHLHSTYVLIGANIQGATSAWSSVTDAVGSKAAYITYQAFVTDGDTFSYQFDVCNHADNNVRTHTVSISYDNGNSWSELSSGTFGSTAGHSLSGDSITLPHNDASATKSLRVGFTGTVLIRSEISNPPEHDAGTTPESIGWKSIHLHCKACANFQLIPTQFASLSVNSQAGHTMSRLGGLTAHTYYDSSPETPKTRTIYRNDVHGMGLILVKASAGFHCRHTEMGYMKATTYEVISTESYPQCGSISLFYESNRLKITHAKELDHLSVSCLGDCTPWIYNHA